MPLDIFVFYGKGDGLGFGELYLSVDIFLGRRDFYCRVAYKGCHNGTVFTHTQRAVPGGTTTGA